MTQQFTAPDSHDSALSIVPAAGSGEEKRQLLSIAASDNGSEFIYSSFRLHKNGLTPVGIPTREEWLECGRFIRHAEASVHFWIGDWLTGKCPTK